MGTETVIEDTELLDEGMEGGVLADGLRLGLPAWQGTNLLFALSNATPECPCNLLFATNLNTPIVWTTIAQGTNYGSVAKFVGECAHIGMLVHKQFQGGEGMAAGRAVKVLLATCPRALLRSTLP